MDRQLWAECSKKAADDGGAALNWFIVNPQSDRGSTGRMWPQIRTAAEKRLGRMQVRMTSRPGEAVLLTREALAQGACRVVCVGGDGTLNEVVNGYLTARRKPNGEVPLGFVPRGTGCDLARSLSIPRDFQSALALVHPGVTRRIDVGEVRYRDHRDRLTRRYFHNVASFGLAGDVDERVNRTNVRLGGFAAFLWATLVALLRYDRKTIRLIVDDHFDEEISIWNVAVANGQYHGAGMWVAPGARMDDGLFRITVVGDLTLTRVFANLHNLYNGKIYGVRGVKSLTGRRIEAFSSQRVLLDLDGEQPGSLPLTARILPRALPFLCA